VLSALALIAVGVRMPVQAPGETYQWEYTRKDDPPHKMKLTVTFTEIREVHTVTGEIVSDQPISLDGETPYEFATRRYSELVRDGWALTGILNHLAAPPGGGWMSGSCSGPS
jgi:hypothetical protein